MEDDVKAVNDMLDKERDYIVVGVTFNKPGSDTDRVIGIYNHFNSFKKRTGFEGSISLFNRESKYDSRLSFRTPRGANTYIDEAKKMFPDYSFTITIDPRENLGRFEAVERLSKKR